LCVAADVRTGVGCEYALYRLRLLRDVDGPARVGERGVRRGGFEIGSGHLVLLGSGAGRPGFLFGNGRGTPERGLGLTEDGAVDHAAVQLEDALVAPGRVQDTAGPGDLVVVGRVRLSDGGHLGRVDTGGGHEPERDG